MTDGDSTHFVRRLPGFGPEWRRDIRGGWYAPNECYLWGVSKRVNTEADPPVRLAWGGEWSDEGRSDCILAQGVRFGLPEASGDPGVSLPLPSRTGIGFAAIVGPDTMEWEPTAIELQAFPQMWARVLRQVCDRERHELALIPSSVNLDGWETRSTNPSTRAQALEHFIAESGCEHIAHFEPADFSLEDPYLLPWDYVRCLPDQIEKVFARAGGPGATGFIVERGAAHEVTDWAKIASPVARLDAHLDRCQLVFEVCWHGEGLVIATRHVDPDDIETACCAAEVARIVAQLRPRRPPPGVTEPVREDDFSPRAENDD